MQVEERLLLHHRDVSQHARHFHILVVQVLLVLLRLAIVVSNLRLPQGPDRLDPCGLQPLTSRDCEDTLVYHLTAPQTIDLCHRSKAGGVELKVKPASGKSREMRLHLNKPGIRALGVAESFKEGDLKSRLAGVVMRSDLVIDGFVLGTATVGGDDATGSVVKMFRLLRRNDVNLIILSGCIISMYNIVEVDSVSKRTGLPVICLTYNESRGIERAIKQHFNDSGKKDASYRSLGERHRVKL